MLEYVVINLINQAGCLLRLQKFNPENQWGNGAIPLIEWVSTMTGGIPRNGRKA